MSDEAIEPIELTDDPPGAALHVVRNDGWENAVTGLGGIRDKTTYHALKVGHQLSDGELEVLFNEDDIAAKVVDKLPREATRGGFKLDIKGAEGKDAASTSSAIVAEATRLGVMPKFREGWTWARLYGGGSGVFVGARDGLALHKPLNMARVNSIEFLNIVTRPHLRVHKRYARIDQPKYGEPELYRIAMPGEDEIVIHETRLILFRGAMTANTQSVSLNKDWDNSVLQRVYDALNQSSSAWMSVMHLMSDASQGVLKIKDFTQMLKAQGQGALRNRLQAMDMARSVCRAIAIDADKEEFTRVATSFAGLAELLDKQMLRVSAAAEMPQTVLFGRSPAGMNATGESDTRSWYDTVGDARDSDLKPRLEQMIRLIMAVPQGPTSGKILDEWEIKFPPLWQPTEKERADVFKTKSDALVALVTAQICEPEAAALHLAHSGDFNELDVDTLEGILEAVRKAREDDPLGEDDLPPDPGVVGDNPNDPNAPPPDKSGNQNTDVP